MRLLILGGTVFLGRHLVELALERGDDVTILHRGQHGADLFAGTSVRRVIGDRNDDLSALDAEAPFDAMIDCSGQLPRQVRAIAEQLAGRVGHTTFVSSVSVYADLSEPDVDESAPTETLPDPDVEGMEHYGGLKAACEATALERSGPDGLGVVRCVRPGLIVGPYDPSGRFTWWPVRTAGGGRMLVPGRKARLVQVIDARDLAEFLLDGAAKGLDGTVNATGPATGTLTMGDVVDACVMAAGAGAAEPVWVEDEVALLEAGAEPWMELPLWIPEEGEHAGLMTVSVARAAAEGLVCRPLAETAADTLAWAQSVDPERAVPPGAGIDPEKEAKLLADLAG